jgi:hypothetical protein
MGRKRAKNLLLDAQVLNAAEAYCAHHGTSLSRLVEDFLERLPPLYGDDEPNYAIVERLRGAAVNARMRSDDYRDVVFRGRK